MSSLAFFGDWRGFRAPYGAVHPSRKGKRTGFLALLALAIVWMIAAGGPARAEPLRLVAFGDSLTAGLGLPADQAFPARLQAALKAKGHDVLIENAGVSGDTTSAGLARLDWSVPQGTDGVILELGANDALRGINPAITEKALDSMLGRLKGRNIPVLLAGMLAPPNLGPAYGAQFNAIYGHLAEKYQVPLYPFFLDGVAGQPGLNQPDGLHPTSAGVDVIVEKMRPAVEAFVEKIKAAKAG